MPLNNVATTDAGATLQGKSYEINCKSGATTIDQGAVAATDEEARLVRRECTNLKRAAVMSQLFGDMKINDTKPFPSGDGPALFIDEVDQFKIKSWNVKLRALNVGPPVVGTFDLSGTADTSTQVGKSFPDYKGELTIDDKALVIELTLKSSTVHIETMPDGKSQIATKGDLTVTLRRQVIP